MKKQITFIRHAKSSWDTNHQDHDRPLAQRGISDAHHMGQELLRLKFKPDLILSSTATRALQTANIICHSLGMENLIKTKQSLYDFEGRRVEEVLRNTSDEVHSLLIFGHNHAFTFLVNKFGDTHIDNLPTCGVAMITFSGHWNDLKNGETTQILIPKELRNS